MKDNVPEFMEAVRQRVVQRLTDDQARLRASIVPLRWCTLSECWTPETPMEGLGAELGFVHIYGDTTYEELPNGKSHPIEVIVYWDDLHNQPPIRIAYTLIHELAHVAACDGHTDYWVSICKQMGICEVAYEGNSHPGRDGDFQGGDRFWDKDLVRWINENYE